MLAVIIDHRCRSRFVLGKTTDKFSPLTGPMRNRIKRNETSLNSPIFWSPGHQMSWPKTALRPY
ncbi:uncharacterized protein J3R85_008231 [Psidium guajava]|nr:uncharacterized protein J3R85_008231 [Psidium guajava]